MLNMFCQSQADGAGGISWSSINGDLPNDIRIDDMVVDPGNPLNLYAVGQGGAYKSTDAGDNWTAINNGLPTVSGGGQTPDSTPIGFTEIAVDPSNSINIYAGKVGGRIFKSSDKGANWQEITNNLPITPYGETNIAVPLSGDSKTIYIGNYKGVYKSTDGGTTWTEMNKGSLTSCQIYDLAIDPTATQTVYAAAGWSGLYKTQDGGNNWKKVSSNLIEILTIDPNNSNTILAGGCYGVYKSTDGGNNWGTTTGLPSYPSITALAIDPNSTQTVYAGTGGRWENQGKIYKSTNGGISWTELTTFMEKIPILALITGKTTPTTVYVAGSGVFRSKDSGGSWTAINKGLTHYVLVNSLAADPQSTGTIYMGNGRGAFKTVNNGTQWNKMTSTAEAEAISAIAIAPDNSNVVYLASNKSVYKTTDGGVNWVQKNTGLSSYLNSTQLLIDPSDSKTIYLSASWYGLYRTTDSGDSWSQIVSTDVYRILIEPGTSNILYAAGYSSLQRSNDKGANWTSIKNGLPERANVTGMAIDPQNPATLYLGLNGYVKLEQEQQAGFYKSLDRGNNWTKIGEEAVGYLIVHPQFSSILYAVTSKNIAKSLDSGLHWAAANDGLPALTGGQVKLQEGTVGSGGCTALIMSPKDSTIFYAAATPYGVYQGKDTNTVPSPPTVTYPEDNATTPNQKPMFIGTGTPGGIISLYDGSTLLGTTTVGEDVIFTILPTTDLSFGTHLMKVTATDIFGTSLPVLINLKVVNLPGIVPTITHPQNGGTNQGTPTITGTAEAGSTVVIYDGLTPIATVTSNTAGIYSFTPPARLSEGKHKLYVISKNSNGITANSELVEIEIDTEAPMPPWITEPKNGSKTPQDKLTISGQTIANGTVTIYINFKEEGSTTSNQNGKFTWTTPNPLADGIYKITAEVKDAAGNISPPSWPVEVTVGIPPVITSPVSGKTTKNTGLTVTGKCKAGVPIEVYLDDIKVGTPTASNLGTFSYVFTSLAPGTHTLKVREIKGTGTGGFSNVVMLVVHPDLPVDPVGVTISSPRGTEHPMSLDEDDKVGVHWQQEITISVPVTGSPTKVSISYSGKEYLMTGTVGGIYEYKFTPYPLHGNVPLKIIIEYPPQQGGTAEVDIGSLLIDPDGHVYNSVTLDKIVGAVVTCYYFNTSTTTWQVWDAWNYPFNKVPQINPQTTTVTNDCYYSFMVPPGKYYVQAVASGYEPYQSGELVVIEEPVHHDVYLSPIGTVTSIKVTPDPAIVVPSGTYSFTAQAKDQYGREMYGVKFSWSSTIGSVAPNSGASTVFSGPASGSGVITAGTASITGTAAVKICPPANLKIEPSISYAYKNSSFTIKIVVQDVFDLVGATIELSFDKSQIRAGTVTAGAFMTQNCTPLFQPEISNPDGKIEINLSRLNGNPVSVSGSGTIATVGFTAVVDQPNGTITFSHISLRNPENASIPVGQQVPGVVKRQLIGDLGQNGKKEPDEVINYEDLVWFAACWNNWRTQPEYLAMGDIGPADGRVPDLIPQPDGKIDFEDMMVFSLMWNCCYQKPQTSPPVFSVASATQAMVRLTNRQDLGSGQISLDVVVDGVVDLRGARVRLKFDPIVVEVMSVGIGTGTVTGNGTSNIQMLLPTIDNTAGIVEIPTTWLGQSPQEGESIARVVFHRKTDLVTAISFEAVILRNSDNQSIPAQSQSYTLDRYEPNLDKVYLYPNPYLDAQHSEIVFAGLTAQLVRLRVYNLAGELVYEREKHSPAKKGQEKGQEKGTLIWIPKNHSLASGIYIYLLTDDAGHKKIGKLAIIK